MAKLLKKHTMPTSLNREDYGTVWKVEKKESQYYIQLNKDKLRPHWTAMNDFLEKTFCAFFEEHSFIAAALNLYEDDEKSLRAMAEVLKQ